MKRLGLGIGVFVGLTSIAQGFTLISPPVHAGAGQFLHCAVVLLKPGATASVSLLTGNGIDGTDWRATGYVYGTTRPFEQSAGNLPSTDARVCVVTVAGANVTPSDVRASVEVREADKLVAVVGF